MRYTWCSASAARTTRLSACAVARLVPNGFSMTVRTQRGSAGSERRGMAPLRERPSMGIGETLGGAAGRGAARGEALEGDGVDTGGHGEVEEAPPLLPPVGLECLPDRHRGPL